MTLEYAVDALKVLFGRDNVISEKGEIRVRVRYPGHSKPSSVSLTIEQAKFVVAHSISAEDLIDQNYPAGCPGGARPIHGSLYFLASMSDGGDFQRTCTLLAVITRV